MQRDWAYIAIAFSLGALTATLCIYNTTQEAYDYIKDLQGIWAALIGLIAALIAAQQISAQIRASKDERRAALAWEMRTRLSRWKQFFSTPDHYLDQASHVLNPTQLEVPAIDAAQKHEINLAFGNRFLVDLIRLTNCLGLFKTATIDTQRDQETLSDLQQQINSIYKILYEASDT